MIVRDFKRLLPLLMVVCICAGMLYAQGKFEPVRMAYSFNSRWYKNDGMREECLSYLRISRAGLRPLYVTGWGRRGRFDVLIENIIGVGDNFMLSTKGGAVITYKDYPPGARAGARHDYPCAALVDAGTSIRMDVLALRSWMQLDDSLARFLEIREIKNDRFIIGHQYVDPPSPRFNALLDCVASVDGRRVELKGQSAQVQFDLVIGGWGRNLYPIWKMTVCADLKVTGADLGLAGADGGPLDVKLVFGAQSRIPAMNSRADVKNAVEAELKKGLDVPDLMDLF